MAEVLNINLQVPLSEKKEMNYDLQILIRECIAQKRSAQKKLYDIYSPAAYGVIKRYLFNNEHAAQEVLNDAFYKIFTKLDQYSFQGAFEGWIRRIVVNTITDHLRKNIKNDQYVKEIEPEDASVNSTGVENLSHKELISIVNTLPEAQLAVFNLFVFENYPHKEIAKVLNISESNSRWYLNDARRRLKEKISNIM